MAFRRPSMHTFRVFRQDAPTFSGNDRSGDAIYDANLLEVGTVSAMTIDAAFAEAHKICSAPVLEEIQNVK